MPQSPIASPSIGRPRYRIVTDAPLPSEDGILRADDASEQRRLKRAQTTRSSALIGKIGFHLISEFVCLLGSALVLAVGAASFLLFCAHFGDLTLEELTGWEGRPSLVYPLILAAVWAVAVPTWAAVVSDVETVASFLFALVFMALMAPVIVLFAILGGGAIFTLPFGILMTIIAIDKHGFWFCFTIFIWGVLMLTPLLIGYFRRD